MWPCLKMSSETPLYLYRYNYALDSIPEEIREASYDEFSLDNQSVKFTSAEHSKNFLFVSWDLDTIYTADATEIVLSQECYGVHFVEECPATVFFWSRDMVHHLAFLGKNLQSLCEACLWDDGPTMDSEEVNLTIMVRVRPVPVYDPSTRAWV